MVVENRQNSIQQNCCVFERQAGRGSQFWTRLEITPAPPKQTFRHLHPSIGCGKIFVTLPRTGLRLRLPTVRYTVAVSGYTPVDRGMIRDYEASPTIDDVLAGRDAEMEFVLELTRSGN